MARLLKRVFDIDIEHCPNCGGSLEDHRRPFDWLRAAIEDPPVIVRILAHPGLPSRPWYWYMTSAQQAVFDEVWRPIVAWHRDTIRKFAHKNPIHPLILPGVPHYVYINNETEVVREMRKFLGLPVGGN